MGIVSTAFFTKMADPNIKDLLGKMTKEVINEIINEAQKDRRSRGSLFPSIDSEYLRSTKFEYKIPRPAGSTDLLDEDGNVLMRDGELVERPVETSYQRYVLPLQLDDDI